MTLPWYLWALLVVSCIGFLLDCRNFYRNAVHGGRGSLWLVNIVVMSAELGVAIWILVYGNGGGS